MHRMAGEGIRKTDPSLLDALIKHRIFHLYSIHWPLPILTPNSLLLKVIKHDITKILAL
jgi:hypothetical protein